MDGKRSWHPRDIAATGRVTAMDVQAAPRNEGAEPTTDLVIDSLNEFAIGRVAAGCSCCQNYMFEPLRQWA